MCLRQSRQQQRAGAHGSSGKAQAAGLHRMSRRTSCRGAFPNQSSSVSGARAHHATKHCPLYTSCWASAASWAMGCRPGVLTPHTCLGAACVGGGVAAAPAVGVSVSSATPVAAAGLAAGATSSPPSSAPSSSGNPAGKGCHTTLTGASISSAGPLLLPVSGDVASTQDGHAACSQTACGAAHYMCQSCSCWSSAA